MEATASAGILSSVVFCWDEDARLRSGVRDDSFCCQVAALKVGCHMKASRLSGAERAVSSSGGIGAGTQVTGHSTFTTQAG